MFGWFKKKPKEKVVVRNTTVSPSYTQTPTAVPTSTVVYRDNDTSMDMLTAAALLNINSSNHETYEKSHPTTSHETVSDTPDNSYSSSYSSSSSSSDSSYSSNSSDDSYSSSYDSGSSDSSSYSSD